MLVYLEGNDNKRFKVGETFHISDFNLESSSAQVMGHTPGQQVGKNIWHPFSPSKSTVSTGLLLWRNDACWLALGSWPLECFFFRLRNCVLAASPKKC